MEVHSTKAMAARAVAVCVELLYEDASAESVAEVLRAHGEAVAAAPTGSPAPPPAAASGGAPPGGAGADRPGAESLSEDDVRAMREAARRLVEVFAASAPDAAAALLNRILAETARPPRLTSHDGTTPWHVHVDAHDDVPWAEWFLASSAMALAVLLADHQRVPGGLCASPGCRRPYLDLGGGSARRYCSPRCATRERVAAHRARA